VKKVINRITEEDGEGHSVCHLYQGFEIVDVCSSMEYFERNFTVWIDAVTSGLWCRLKAQDVDSFTILAIHGWEQE